MSGPQGGRPIRTLMLFGNYRRYSSVSPVGEPPPLVTMVLYKPRSWCVYCPMGTMTQLICQVKNKA